MSFIKHFTTSGGRIHPISRTLQICRRNVTGTTLTFAAPSSFPSEARESKFTESWLPSGMKVCTYETGSPLVTLSLVVFAGSRNDDPAHLGTAHVLQRTLIRGLPCDTSVRVFLLTELRGNSLDSYHTRELIVITSSFMRDDLVDVVPLLYSNAMNYEFMPHEMIRYRKQILEQANLFNSNTVFVLHELLHSVAFRENLGNPLIAPGDQISSITRAMVNDFRSKYFIPKRMAFIGHGIDHASLQKVLSTSIPESKTLSTDEGPLNTPAKYYGGESCIFQPASVPADLLLAFPTPGYSDKGYAISKVATEMLGSCPRIKSFKTELVPYPLSTCTKGTSVTASCSLIQYSDIGLAVTYFHGMPKDVNHCSKKAFELMCGFAKNVPDEDLSRAKAAALLSLEKVMGKGHEFCLETATGLFSGGNTLSPKKCAGLISQVTANDVKKLFSDSLKHKPSLTYLGYTPDLPHIDDFIFKY